MLDPSLNSPPLRSESIGCSRRTAPAPWNSARAAGCHGRWASFPATAAPASSGAPRGTSAAFSTSCCHLAARAAGSCWLWTSATAPGTSLCAMSRTLVHAMPLAYTDRTRLPHALRVCTRRVCPGRYELGIPQGMLMRLLKPGGGGGAGEDGMVGQGAFVNAVSDAWGSDVAAALPGRVMSAIRCAHGAQSPLVPRVTPIR